MEKGGARKSDVGAYWETLLGDAGRETENARAGCYGKFGVSNFLWEILC